MNNELNICIVGMGSRGLTVLEQIIHQAPRYKTQFAAVFVHMVDPGKPGVGIHDTDQPEYFLLNTICSQLTAFSEPSSKEHLCFYQWSKQRYQSVRTIDPGDFLPRRWLGEYLSWSYEMLCQQAPDHLRMKHYQTEAVDIQSSRCGRERVILQDHTSILAEGVFLTTGHANIK